jgi:hypothetical protein
MFITNALKLSEAETLNKRKDVDFIRKVNSNKGVKKVGLKGKASKRA